VIALLLGSQAAQAQRGALEGTLVDTEGNPAGKHVLILEPLAGGSQIKLKTKASGKFAHGFLIQGPYRITSADEKAYLSHFDVVVSRTPGGSEVSRWASDADPEAGLPPFRITSGHKTTMTVVLSDEAHRRRVRQAIASAAVAGPLQAALDRYDAGDMEGTLAEAQRVLDEQPDLAYGHFLRGIALTSLGRGEEAEQALRAAADLDKELPDVAGALGTALLQRARELETTDGEQAQAMLIEAAELLEKQVEQSEEPATAILTNWAMALDKSGQNEQAIAVLERLIDADPTIQAAYYHLADLHRQAGDEEKALAILERIQSNAEDVSSADVIYNMAVQAFNAGNYDKALTVLERTLVVDPDFVLAHHLRGRIFLAKEDYEGAKRELGRFVELAPEHPTAAEDRAILESLASMDGG
jgi:tetratricopeptide (TPR) repeat protein